MTAGQGSTDAVIAGDRIPTIIEAGILLFLARKLTAPAVCKKFSAPSSR